MSTSVRLVADCASDPPLGATGRALATARAGDVLYGLGAAALERGARELAVAVRDAAARDAVATAAEAMGAHVHVMYMPDAWPAAVGGASASVGVGGEVVLGAAELVAAGARCASRRCWRWIRR